MQASKMMKARFVMKIRSDDQWEDGSKHERPGFVIKGASEADEECSSTLEETYHSIEDVPRSNASFRSDPWEKIEDLTLKGGNNMAKMNFTAFFVNAMAIFPDSLPGGIRN